MRLPWFKRGGAGAPPRTSSGAETYELGGRRFVNVSQSTLEHRIWFENRFEDAGLDVVVLGKHESGDEFARRILKDLRRSEHFWEMLGALIIPEGASGLDWTPAMAAETGAFLRKVADRPPDQQAFNGLVLSLLIHFFETGLTSLTRSQGSSGNEDQPGAAAASAPRPIGTAGGVTSFGPSPGTIATASAG